MSQVTPPLEKWLAEIKSGPDADRIGMYLMHNGVVRGSSRAGTPVTGMELTYDHAGLASAIERVEQMDGVICVRAWVNEGTLEVGDDIMYALVGGDFREHVFAGLQELVRIIKSEVVAEREAS
ncbi:MAG: molybdopterin converting factor [Actinobacteria bacterium HGW-Actinobacteria-7]|jgi:molybdopterin synthase catalytic subunit|nr:MAG: molybdopterin converting factor [Actinobacteria bacterium HGW-Actinobacteria-7]